MRVRTNPSFVVTLISYQYRPRGKYSVSEDSIINPVGYTFFVKTGSSSLFCYLSTNTASSVSFTLYPFFSAIDVSTPINSPFQFSLPSEDSTTLSSVNLIYDSIELMDSDAGLYVVKRDDKYGVIDTRGNIKIYVEYDEIGIDPSQFEKNDIKNGYILVNNLIPVRKDKLWGLYNKNGKLVVNIEYDSFGYIASSNKDAMNLLVIPNYDVIVTCSNKKYGLINSSGRVLIGTLTDDIYLTIESGENHYYMTYNNNKLDVEEYLDSQSIVARDENGTVLNANEINQNNNSTNTTEEENNGQNNGEQNSNNDEQQNGQQEGNQQSAEEQSNVE